MRVGTQALRRLGDADQLQQLDGAGDRGFAVQALVKYQGLANLRSGFRAAAWTAKPRSRPW